MLNIMYKKSILTILLSLAAFIVNCQNSPEYQVYALKYWDGRNIRAQQMVVGADPKDSIRLCYMFWFLKGENNKNILVDVGMIDTAKVRRRNFVRPDSVLLRLNIRPSDITDIIITHPHNDHIGGINLFPNAKVWMQKDDYDYFVGEVWQDKKASGYYQKNDVRNLIEINLQGRLILVKGDNIEIIPGIRAYTGSKHTYENQYLLVNSKKDKVLLASDAVWFYYNLDHLLPATLCIDPVAYVEAMKRMKTLVSSPDLIIPGHDDLVFSKFPKVSEWVVKIGN